MSMIMNILKAEADPECPVFFFYPVYKHIDPYYCTQ